MQIELEKQHNNQPIIMAVLLLRGN